MHSACLVGLGIRAFTVGFVPAGTSGRNRREQVASTLKVTGMYSLTRNPLYFGNAVIYMSIAVFTEGVYFVIVMALFLVIYLERIIAAEEHYLAARFGSAYSEWAKSVPAFFPRFSSWKSPELEFSLRNVLRREYSGFFAIIVAFAAIELLEGVLIFGRLLFDEAWVITFIVAAIVYVTLRFLNRRTTVLHVPGR
ncbi:MAG: methyltransferase family protein [Methyloceanibacter sp.]|uniref:methyltransferase family protein n=1 Tax=Methyloceanibacter sp. TaxID=1965321 RepID=UPI003D9B6950